MKLLALETSTDQGSIALLQDDAVHLQRLPGRGAGHSAALLPAVEALLAEHGLALSQLDGIALGIGPGAFTGLRLACGVAQGLALALECPVLPISTLLALAEAARLAHPALTANTVFYSLLDARMSEVYGAAYRYHAEAGGSWREVLAGFCAPPDQLILPDPATVDSPWLMVGNALTAYPQLQHRVSAPLVSSAEAYPCATAIARLGAAAYRRGEGIDPVLLAPWYVRDKVAQTTAERLAAGGKA